MTQVSQDIRQAAAILESGGLIAFPTETVYGLGADAENAQAVARIFAVKGRPASHPLIVHLPVGADLAYWAADVPDVARKVIAAFWPGPLTLILKRSNRVPDAVSGGQDTVGLRCPSHPIAQDLLRTFRQGRGGVAAPSANRFGHVSPTTAQHVQDEFGDDGRLAMILDGGQSQIGIESTILDLSRWDTKGAVLLRPGGVTAADIASLIGQWPSAPDVAAPRVSGSLDAHYAPRTPVMLLSHDAVIDQLQQWQAAGKRVALMHHSQISPALALSSRTLPADPQGYAHGLYAALRFLDLAGADVIAVEMPPQGEAWHGINDRLRRAAHDSLGRA